MTTPGNNPRDKSLPDKRPPKPQNPDRSASVPPQSHGPPPLPKPVRPLDYAGLDSRAKPRPWLMLGSIICGTASVVVAIGSFFVVTSAIRGPYRFNLALMAALTALGACTFGMVRLFGRNRAAAGVAIGLLVVMLIGCAGLAMTCGNGWHD